MYISHIETNVRAYRVTVHKESEEPIRMAFGKYGETGVHMTRDEALNLMSLLEKSIHQMDEKEVL